MNKYFVKDILQLSMRVMRVISVCVCVCMYFWLCLYLVLILMVCWLHKMIGKYFHIVWN